MKDHFYFYDIIGYIMFYRDIELDNTFYYFVLMEISMKRTELPHYPVREHYHHISATRHKKHNISLLF